MKDLPEYIKLQLFNLCTDICFEKLRQSDSHAANQPMRELLAVLEISPRFTIDDQAINAFQNRRLELLGQLGMDKEFNQLYSRLKRSAKKTLN